MQPNCKGVLLQVPASGVSPSDGAVQLRRFPSSGLDLAERNWVPACMIVPRWGGTGRAGRGPAPLGGTLEARYANYFEVGHTDVEFVLQFGQSYRADTVPSIHTRVVTDPAYVRTLIQLLEESLARFEAEHGAVPPRPERVDG